MKAYKGSRGTAPLILNLGTRWKWVINFTSHSLCPREKTAVPFEQVAGGTRTGFSVAIFSSGTETDSKLRWLVGAKRRKRMRVFRTLWSFAMYRNPGYNKHVTLNKKWKQTKETNNQIEDKKQAFAWCHVFLQLTRRLWKVPQCERGAFYNEIQLLRRLLS